MSLQQLQRNPRGVMRGTCPLTVDGGAGFGYELACVIRRVTDSGMEYWEEIILNLKERELLPSRVNAEESGPAFIWRLLRPANWAKSRPNLGHAC